MSMPIIVGIIVVACLCAWGLVELVGRNLESEKAAAKPARAKAKPAKRAAPARRRAKAR